MASEDEWKASIRRNYSYFKNNIADPLDVVEYLFAETTPPIITDNQKEQIKVTLGFQKSALGLWYVLIQFNVHIEVLYLLYL